MFFKVRTLFLEWLPYILLMNRPGKQFKKPKKQSTHTPSDDSYSSNQQKNSNSSTNRGDDPLKHLINYGQTTGPALYQRIVNGSNKLDPVQQPLLYKSAFTPVQNNKPQVNEGNFFKK